MIIIKTKKIYRLISDYELSFYLKNNDCVVMGKLKGDYPSLKCSRNEDRTFKSCNEIIELFKKKIIAKQKTINDYETQLNNFLEDIKSMGVK